MKKMRQRGAFLSIMIVIYVVLWFGRLISVFAPLESQLYQGSIVSYELNILLFIVVTLGLIGIFLWYKWGVYLLGTASLGSIVFNIIFFPQQVSPLGHVLSLLPICLLIWAVSKQWQYFR